MLRRLLDFQLAITAEGKPLHFLRPLASAIDTFCYEVPLKTTRGPHIRDAIDLKRWMVLVVFALIPCTLMAIWNTGLQKLVYTSGSYTLLNSFLSISSFREYIDFCFQSGRHWSILWNGLMAFLPVLVISYGVGGMCEGIFAYFRRHEISEGFLVTGILFALILPPTIPYWMVAVGVAVGVIVSKEMFGGTGMNILNPALVCRCFLFFAYPAYMSGNVWVGSNPYIVKQSLVEIVKEQNAPPWDAVSQNSFLGRVNVGPEIARIHVDTIGLTYGITTPLANLIKQKYEFFSGKPIEHAHLSDVKTFMTTDRAKGGLGLPVDLFGSAREFAEARFNQKQFSLGNLFFGNILGSMGETSTFCALLGAALLIATGIGSWRTMLAVAVGAALTALIFQYGARFGIEGGAWNPAKFDLPAYNHLFAGGLAFALVFMATDPVSSPDLPFSHYIYGALIGALTIVIRDINPAFPEGVMLAILFGNVFGPLIDTYSLKRLRRSRRVRAKKAVQ